MGVQGHSDPSIVGFTSVDALVKSATGSSVAVRFLVDSGAKYTVLPHDVWRQLGLSAERRATFELADGSQIERAMSECYIEVEGHRGHTPVVLGEARDVALLGTVTLEEFGLVLNPFDRTLRPARMLLMRLAA